MKFNIQYVSDLHLERYLNKPKPIFEALVKPCAPYLALAGDIGHPNTPLWNNFFKYVSTGWTQVFYITGNHEYYNKKDKSKWKYKQPTTMTERHLEIKESLKLYQNVTMLDIDNPAFYLAKDNIVIIGSTLWSFIPNDKMSLIFNSLNDYNYIALKQAPTPECTAESQEETTATSLTPMDVNILWFRERRILQSQIEFWTTFGANIIVMTHHMPSFSFVMEKYKDNDINYGFASECEDLLTPNVKAWIYGHTHNVSEDILGTTICAVNARGYEFQKIEHFSNETMLSINLS